LAVILALFLTLALDLTNDPGYLLLAWRNYTFETSLFALAIALLVLWFVWQLLAHLLAWLNPLQLLDAGRRLRDRSKARSRTQEGLLHLARCNWQAAYNLLMRGTREKDGGLYNFLGAARAACELGRRDLWLDSLGQAARRFPHETSTINEVRAELLYKSGLYEQSMAVLEQLRKTAINDNHLLTMLKDVYLQLQNWSGLRELLPVLVKNQVLQPGEQLELERRLLAAELKDLVQQAGTDSSARNTNLARVAKLWKKVPEALRTDEALVTYHVKLLTGIGAHHEAAAVIESHLGRQWHDSLIELYGARVLADSARQLIHGEIWLKERPRNAVLLLALGRLCLRNQLWGKARDYFEASLAATATAAVCGELSRLTRQLGDPAASDRYFARYQELSGDGLPSLPLPATVQKSA
jgi:HemY protein